MKIKTLSLTLALSAVLGTMTVRAVAQTAAEPASAGANAALSRGAGDADGAFTSPGRFGEPDGEKMYRRVCAGCHMPDGKGAQGAGIYPALAGNEKLAAGGYPVYVVLHGLNGMPAVGKLMTDKQVVEVVNYVRTHFGNHYTDAVTEADVKTSR